MSDILDRLRGWRARPLLPPLLDDLEVAIKEIECLRRRCNIRRPKEEHIMTNIVDLLRHDWTKADLMSLDAGDVNAVLVRVPAYVLQRAAEEIEFLRLHAGAVTMGESHADLKRRVGPQAVEGET